MQLSDKQITCLLAYLGETRHTVRKRNDSELECSCGASWALFSPEHTRHLNRTFATPADLHAVYSALMRKGEWEEFYWWMIIENNDVPFVENKSAAWLFCLDHPEQIPERMKLAADWIKTTNHMKGENHE